MIQVIIMDAAMHMVEIISMNPVMDQLFILQTL
jgi:hypothetical protein